MSMRLLAAGGGRRAADGKPMWGWTNGPAASIATDGRGWGMLSFSEAASVQITCTEPRKLNPIMVAYFRVLWGVAAWRDPDGLP